jgi:PST family polysaccharide transporter
MVLNLTAPRDIAINKDNKEKLSEIVSSVMQIKIFLFLFSLLLLLFFINTFERFRQDAIVYYISFGAVLGQMLFPVWFFQGMEKMKYITIFNIISKTNFYYFNICFGKTRIRLLFSSSINDDRFNCSWCRFFFYYHTYF